MNIRWLPADPSNYTPGRDGHKPKFIVIHVQDGHEAGTEHWFQTPGTNVSAHYLVSMAGELVQMVKDEDTAWHCGSTFLDNQTSIGIEHEGMPAAGLWVPADAQLQASAILVADVCTRYGIVPSAQTIIHHHQLNPNHNCPGPTWPSGRFIQMVQGLCAAPAHKPVQKTKTFRLFDPATNLQTGTVTYIEGTDKVYEIPKT